MSILWQSRAESRQCTMRRLSLPHFLNSITSLGNASKAMSLHLIRPHAEPLKTLCAQISDVAIPTNPNRRAFRVAPTAVGAAESLHATSANIASFTPILARGSGVIIGGSHH